MRNVVVATADRLHIDPRVAEQWVMRPATSLVAAVALVFLSMMPGLAPPSAAEGGVASPPPSGGSGATTGAVFLQSDPVFPVGHGAPLVAGLKVRARGAAATCVELVIVNATEETTGNAIPSHALKAKDTQCRNIPAGAVEEFHIVNDPAYFARPGKSKATVLLREGKALGDSADTRATVTFVRGRPRIEVAAPSRVIATKWAPFASGSGQSDLIVRETSGLADADALTVSSDPIVGPDKTASGSTSIKAELRDVSGQPKPRLSANESAALTVRITDISRTGELQTKIVLASPSLEQPISVPLTVVARDHWFWALLVIGAGVLLSWYVLRWSEQLQPVYQLELQLRRLDDEISGYLATVTESQIKQRLERLRKEVAAAFQDALDGEMDNAKKRLTESRASFERIKGEASASPPGVLAFVALGGVSGAEVDDVRSKLRWGRAVITIVAMIIASAIALSSLYQDKAFGGWDYLSAFLWGFGIDAAVKGFGPVLTRISGRRS